MFEAENARSSPVFYCVVVPVIVAAKVNSIDIVLVQFNLNIALTTCLSLISLDLLSANQKLSFISREHISANYRKV